jgi:hypothetical protein
LIVGSGFSLVGLTWWLERSTQRPGLAALIGGFLLLIGAVAGLVAGQRLLPAIFAIQAVALFYHAHWQYHAYSQE